MNDLIEELTEVLRARRGADPSASYVAGLYSKGLNAILEKIGEEAIMAITSRRCFSR